jgi:hypothetical protein
LALNQLIQRGREATGAFRRVRLDTVVGMNGSSTVADGAVASAVGGHHGVQARSRRRTHFGRAALIGLCAGLVAVAFRRALAVVEAGRADLLVMLHHHAAWGWLVLPGIVLVVG